MRVLVTGSAGFIGFHVSRALLDRGDAVIGIDNLNNSVNQEKLKEDRHKELLGKKKGNNYELHQIDICNEDALEDIFKNKKIDAICHLAAQAGVRYSFENPQIYAKTNYEGTTNIFEAAKKNNIKRIVYASRSSVYGNNPIPWKEDDSVNEQINPYGASKRACELLADMYRKIHKLNIIGLRFFTVYGPWGRPDMAYFIFADKIAHGEEITVRTHQPAVKRDFTYIDDIVQGVLAALDKNTLFEVYNLGNSNAEGLDKLIALIESNLGKKAQKKFEPLQPGEFVRNGADIEKAKRDLGFEPKTRLEEGIKKFVDWYKEYHKIS
ncbi:MAG: NAD-dependent epimerase/dehydratase family protein [Patescibacteria group bacterium]